MNAGSQRLACLLLSVMVTGLTLVPWLPAMRSERAEPANPSVIRVALLPEPATSALPVLDPAQSSLPNSTGHTNQTDRPPGPLDEADAYLPLSRLTEWPVANGDTDAELAIVSDGSGQGSAVQWLEAVLLINEFGDIDRVLLPDADSSQQAILTEHLRRLRFAPGRLFGQPVKSALRIELRLQ